MSGELQQVLGTDKRNPCFTVFRQIESGLLLLFYGGELLEKLPDDRNHAQYKLMVAQLYNAGVNSRCLREVFEVDFKTMRRWGRALEGGDVDELARVLEGRQANRKLTLEIQAYVRMRFLHIYPDNRRSYSQVIREEIVEVFNRELSAETLRPLFGELKRQFVSGGPGKTACDVPEEKDSEPGAFEPQGPGVLRSSPDEHLDSNRKESPSFEADISIRFAHHLGVLLFSEVLLLVERIGGDWGWILKQWLCSILLGAVNIEQSKLLDVDGLSLILGRTLKSRHPQRVLLARMADAGIVNRLYELNASLVGTDKCDDFFYDPHTKQYTGTMKILKGWCGSRHFADKALHMDFIHTAAGKPVYVSYDDNYADLRGRYHHVISSMRTNLKMKSDRVLTLVFDRGIYGQSTFEQIIKDPHLKVVTWEKNYQLGHWNKALASHHFVMHRSRNRANDIRVYTFEYQSETWEKNAAMCLIRVRATNPNGRTVELGILSNQPERNPEELILLMFTRWLQENDFKYMEKHFGINQITSYATLSYADLQESLEDRQVKSGEYKALQKQRSSLRAKLKTELLKEHRHPGESAARTQRIRLLTEKDDAQTQTMTETEREVSRIDTLIQGEFRKLNTSSKQIYDALKLIARNAFYNALSPFKENYDNYRDDHTLFRNLTHAPGLFIDKGTHIKAILHPTAHHHPARRKLIEELLEQITHSALLLPDQTGRPITLELGAKEGIVLAIKTR